MLGPDGEQGIADLAALEAIHETLLQTAEVQSGRGGRHHYFRFPADELKILLRKNHNGTKIDVLGDGGYAMAPPSINANGQYDWLEECELADAPPWLLKWVGTNPEKTREDTPPSPRSGSGGAQAVMERARKYLGKIPSAAAGKVATTKPLPRPVRWSTGSTSGKPLRSTCY